MRARRWGGLALVLSIGASVALASTASAANPSPPFIPRAADWLTSVNYFRAMAGLPAVTEDLSLSPGALNHSCYMLLNDIAHDEIPGNPGYTESGDSAGNNGNVAVSSATGLTNRSFVELWMTGPFHAIGVLRSNLQRVGFGQCENTATARWHSGATLDILHGLGPKQPLGAPVLFPGDGTVTNLTQFIAESPNPVQLCGWTGGAGLPIIGLMPEGFTSNPTASITGPSGPIETCVLSRHNTSGTAQSILQGDNAVVVMPRAALAAGTYTVNVSTSARNVTWSFSVDPSAADASVAPPSSTPASALTGWTPMAPARFVDTRINNGATKLIGGVPKRIKLTGRLGLPVEALAVSGNFTVANTGGVGYLTVWNCSNPMPDASTLNFVTGDVVSNSATTPLDGAGNVCVYSPVSSDLIIDVSGYYTTTATTRFAAIVPERLMDTRQGIGPTGRMAAGQIIELPLPSAPGDAVGVMINITTINADETGYVTAFPCGGLPNTSSVNPGAGDVRPNTATLALSAARSVCLYTSQNMDVLVDVFGYMVTSPTARFTPSAPFRWVDTRSKWSTDLNFGTGGQRVNAGQVLTLQIAGQRGIPANATSLSFNLTAVDGAGDNGYVIAYPCGSQPPTSNVNFRYGQNVANGAMVALSASGSLCLYAAVSTHLILDVNGWWT